LEQQPRQLIGKTVPKTDGTEGDEVLKDSADAREWQETVRAELIKEVRDRTSRKADEARSSMETLHSSLKLFQDNADLVPDTKQFDLELATQFLAFARAYEKVEDGKFVGYTIPVQPLVDQVRATLTAARTAAAAATGAAAPTAQQQAAAAQARNQAGQFTNPDAPQAGIQSRAGNSAEGKEDMTAFWATLGLPDLQL